MVDAEVREVRELARGDRVDPGDKDQAVRPERRRSPRRERLEREVRHLPVDGARTLRLIPRRVRAAADAADRLRPRRWTT